MIITTRQLVNVKSIYFLPLCFTINISLSYAQRQDSFPTNKPNNAALIAEDTTNFLDKFMIAELEKVQYSRYSDSLKKQTLEELVKNQKLHNATLLQKLQNQELKADAEKKQADANLSKAEAERVKSEAEKQQELQNQKIKELQVAELQHRLTLENRTQSFLYLGLALLSALGISLLWSNWQLKKRNKAIQQLSVENIQKEQEKQQILATQNETLERQVEERTSQLKASQNQLIQKEKLASLGELTAGIAHEIQNPLNFVNNFAELSVGLAHELKEEMAKINIPDQDKDYISEILTDLTQNQEKINHHGKRASNIVKGMLEHSRTSTGVKELTDINKLVDEYIRLTYHGMRAKDKAFNSDFKLELDESIPKISVIPQDMGRVLINLFNNAFYAVHQKKLLAPEGYTPSVSALTKVIDNQIVITVKDNGNGIPDAIKQKIFQPFFTTKPTGEGTGLGLSLSYDIVTKGHGGSLEVESSEGVGSAFIIRLPI